MKHKLIHSEFNPETGVSTVIIQNKYGHFTGKAKLDAADAAYPSKFQGCEYAEMKAIMSYLDERILLLRIEQKALMNCYVEMKQSCHFNENSFEVKHLKKSIWNKSKLIVKLVGEKEQIKNRMEINIAERDISAKHLSKHRNKIQQMGKKD